MNKILNYGSLNIDKTFSLDHIVKPGETISSYAFNINAGGKGCNQAGALSKAGLDVFMAGKVGSDGEFLLELLNEFNVNIDYINQTGSATGQAIIQVSKEGQNSIILSPGSNNENTKEEIDLVLENFNKGDFLILQNEINNVEYIINKGYEKELTICFNPSPFNDEILQLPLDKISYFFVNEIEAAQIIQSDSISDYVNTLEIINKKFPNSHIVMTIGKEGAYYSYQGTKYHQPIIDAPVVDTTAAGDTFMGYFIASLIYNYQVKDALYYATKASAVTVSKKGALISIPLKEDIFN